MLTKTHIKVLNEFSNITSTDRELQQKRLKVTCWKGRKTEPVELGRHMQLISKRKITCTRNQCRGVL